LAVANRFFLDTDNLLVLSIDEASVASWLVNEGPAGVGDAFAHDVFPHLYGPIPVSAVVAATPLVAGGDGRFDWPMELPRT
jgi:uncharacterized protein (DUF952 family)